jgi:hypothetical protein
MIATTTHEVLGAARARSPSWRGWTDSKNEPWRLLSRISASRGSKMLDRDADGYALTPPIIIGAAAWAYDRSARYWGEKTCE